jgi:hypothetical protein
LEATKAVTAAPNSIVNPEAGLISDIRWPTWKLNKVVDMLIR